MSDIYSFLSYKKYLENRLGKRGSRTGLRKKLSEFMNVHTTFVSQVLLDKADFSLEQAESVNDFLAHTDDESDYFLNLVTYGRAGSAPLKRRLKSKLTELRTKHLNIQKRFNTPDSITKEQKQKFYSTHLYGAIHVLTSIPGFQTIDELSEALRISRDKLKAMVEFLLKLGIVQNNMGQLIPGSNHVHIGDDSDLIVQHHRNWRLHSLTQVHQKEKTDVRYSACLSLSKEDAFKIKNLILDNLENNIKLVGPSKEETAYVYNIDFYPLVEKK